MRYIFLTILIAVSLGVFFFFLKPQYQSARALQQQVAVYNSSLDTADKLKTSREELIAKYNSISKTDLDNIRSLLPDTVDNIRLVIQLDALAARNGLSTIKNVNYQTEKEKQENETPETSRLPYGEFVISFETSGQYKNFLSFLSDLEENLRLVDVTEVSFLEGSTAATASGVLSYKLTLKTYWLKQ